MEPTVTAGIDRPNQKAPSREIQLGPQTARAAALSALSVYPERGNSSSRAEALTNGIGRARVSVRESECGQTEAVFEGYLLKSVVATGRAAVTSIEVDLEEERVFVGF